MQKYLIYEDGKSHKFWTISTENNSFTVVFGKVGTSGQTQTKTYGTPEEAEKEALKQANAKIKKGYVETEAPADFSVDPAKGKTTEAKAKPKAVVPQGKKTPPVAAEKLVPVKEDGELKPWHNDEWWEYSWYCPDEENFANLAETDEDDIEGEAAIEPEAQPKPEKEKVIYNWGERDEVDDDDDDDEDDTSSDSAYSIRSSFIRMCRRGYFDEAKKRWALLQERQAKGEKDASAEELQSVLNKAVADIMDSYSIDSRKIDVLQWLLEQGAAMCDEDDCDTALARFIYVQYVENKVKPADIAATYAEYCKNCVVELIPQYADNILELVEYLKTGQKRENSLIKSDAPENGWPEDCYGLGLYFSEDTPMWSKVKL